MKRYLIGLLIGFLAISAFGVQQIQYQHQQTHDAKVNAERDACYERWGRDVITALDARSVGTKISDKAESVAAAARVRKDNAGDRVFLLVAAAVANPNEDQAKANRQFTAALQEFVAAKQKLVRSEKVRKAAEKARDALRVDNPFPRLSCGGRQSQLSGAIRVLLAMIASSSVPAPRVSTVLP